MEMVISINEIEIDDRIREDCGDLEDLATSIKENGLINPVTVMQKEAGGYSLIAGLRRVKACEILGWEEVTASVHSPMDADQMIKLEIAENEKRKEFTYEERVKYTERLEVIEKEKARLRKSKHARDGYEKDRGICPYADPEEKKGRTKDIIAKEAGFGSRRQMERARFLAENRPDLLDQVDKGKKSLNQAVNEAKKEQKDNNASEGAFIVPANESAPVHIGISHPEQWKILQMFRPVDVKPAGKGIAGADHFKLMENEIYATIYKKYEEAVQSANIVIGSFDHMKSEFDTVLRGIQSNLDTALENNKKLEEENRELRRRLEEIS